MLNDGAPKRNRIVPSERGLLFVYGSLDLSGLSVTAEAIYRSLTGQGVWLMARRVNVDANLPVIFYQVARGFTGAATVREIALDRTDESAILRSFPVSMFPHKVFLDNIETFDAPLPAQDLLQQLSFITNKTYWGHSFRISPRYIPIDDCRVIIERGRKQSKAHTQD